MRIAICIIYVHDDVDVSAYEYVNDNGYVYTTFDSICQVRISIFIPRL